MRILGFESTCDETGCAIVDEGRHIRSNIVSSQIEVHRVFGGVVPELACRHHIEVIIPVLTQAIEKARVELSSVDAIAVAHGPGLIGALLVGLTAAKGLALALNKPLVGVNHIEAHLYAALMENTDIVRFPCLGVVVSGGHTSLVLVHDIGRYELIGQTVDDAIGEAFDKVAKILGLPYPGGPAVEDLSKDGDPSKYNFSVGRVKGRPLDLSYSGLKTAVLYAVKGVGAKVNGPSILDEKEYCHVAAAFQETALRALVLRCQKAVQLHSCSTVLLGGGVTNNRRLRTLMQEGLPGCSLYWPAQGLELDNAAMIAGLGYHIYRKAPEGHGLHLTPQTRIPW